MKSKAIAVLIHVSLKSIFCDRTTMAAVAYNLKKLLKHTCKNIIANLQLLKKQEAVLSNSVLKLLRCLGNLFCDKKLVTVTIITM